MGIPPNSQNCIFVVKRNNPTANSFKTYTKKSPTRETCSQTKKTSERALKTRKTNPPRINLGN